MKAKFKKLLAEARKITEDGSRAGAVYFFEDDAAAAGYRGDSILTIAGRSPRVEKDDDAEVEDNDRARGRKRRGHRQFPKDRW